MNLDKLKEKAEKQVVLKYDAWKNLTGVERTALVYQEMLKILEKEDENTFRSRLMVARAIWKDRLWSANSESFPAYLCDVGGRYQNEDGAPSGVAYDLANYVSVVWDVLVRLDENPVDIAARAWSKARLTVAAVRQNIIMLDSGGEETKSADRSVSIQIVNEKEIRDVVKQAKDKDITFRDMAEKNYTPRVPKFDGDMALKKDGTWDVMLPNLSDPQMALLQRVLKGYAELRLV